MFSPGSESRKIIEQPMAIFLCKRGVCLLQVPLFCHCYHSAGLVKKNTVQDNEHTVLG